MSIELFNLISTQKVLKTYNEQGSKQHYLGTNKKNPNSSHSCVDLVILYFSTVLALS